MPFFYLTEGPTIATIHYDCSKFEIVMPALETFFGIVVPFSRELMNSVFWIGAAFDAEISQIHSYFPGNRMSTHWSRSIGVLFNETIYSC